MAKKHKCPECPAGEKWAVPYADFLSLLLALFIALWAISKTNPAKVEALKTEFVKIFDYTATQTVQQETQDTYKYNLPLNKCAYICTIPKAKELVFPCYNLRWYQFIFKNKIIKEITKIQNDLIKADLVEKVDDGK